METLEAARNFVSVIHNHASVRHAEGTNCNLLTSIGFIVRRSFIGLRLTAAV